MIQGFGCFAVQLIPKGQRVVEYTGPKISCEEAVRALKNGNRYIFTVDSKFSIDGSVLSNLARYINHSCDPNCESDIVNGRVWIDAKRDIQEGEELSVNHAYDFQGFSKRLCRCGTENCLGYMISENHTKLLGTMIDLANEATLSDKD